METLKRIGRALSAAASWAGRKWESLVWRYAVAGLLFGVAVVVALRQWPGAALVAVPAACALMGAVYGWRRAWD